MPYLKLEKIICALKRSPDQNLNSPPTPKMSRGNDEDMEIIPETPSLVRKDEGEGNMILG
ncbi:hypothetical protein A2U01_0048678 [Trifolium medium]|uniref:Uncharacterized protein n=1 Tax=Trifolium medium TaxID=97028 RepID=A0A392QTY9_9FABA|nr:hypothetical protein [Trifolium medium]